MEKTFNAHAAERDLYDKWEADGCFEAGKYVNNAETGTFCIMIPPPNVTGALHMGHAFNNTLQDILVRWHRMRGFDTLWQPGQDHAGIATQMVVERALAKTNRRRTDMSRAEFTTLVWEQKKTSGGTIIEQLKRLGASCDWSRTAFTMSGAPGAPEEEGGNFHDAVIKVFVQMYNDGLIYRDKRLVNWDPHFETAISDLEVENEERTGHMWHFKYPLADGETYEYVEKDEDGTETLRETRDYISIATTRPETMLGDGAVAVHPSDERYAPIIGKQVHLPLCDRTIPIIADEYPDPKFGSGAVKITGAHDFNDHAVAKRNGIALYALMDTKGAMRRDAAEDNLVPAKYRGMDRFDARKAVVADITAQGLAVMVPETDPRLGKPATPLAPEEGGETRAAQLVPLVETKLIMQPFGDRSKVIIEPMLTDQWFVKTEDIVDPALEAVRSGETEILPEQHKKVYFQWLENIEPWCISRQLWWGHQIPVWYGPNREDLEAYSPPSDNPHADGSITVLNTRDSKIFCGPNSHSAIREAQAYYGQEIKVEEVELSESAPGYKYGIRGGGKTRFVGLHRDPDVLDTWFSSGLWPIGTLGWPENTEALQKYFPTNTLVTGFDIIFFWVARMMMMQYAVVGQKPFDTVYVHALVRDEKGKKMSKSVGNVIDPLEVIDEFGTDAVRFTLTAMAAMGRDLKLSTNRIAGYRNFGTKLWNAVRFAEMNEVYAQAPPQAIPEAAQTVNRWIIGETAKVRAEVDQALTAYRFNDAANALYAFVWGKVCDWYVEFSKPLLLDGSDAQKLETRATMAWVLDQCMILLHPIMPFITEELWRVTDEKRDTMLIHAPWPDYDASLVDEDADAEMNWVIALIEAVRSARGEMNVPGKLEVELAALELNATGQKAWDNNAPLIRKLARISHLSTVSAPPKGALTISVPGGSFALPLADIIDVAAEKTRLEKTLAKLDKELAGLRGRLKNPKFADNAPEDVVAETRANLAAREEEDGKLKVALARLEDIL